MNHSRKVIEIIFITLFIFSKAVIAQEVDLPDGVFDIPQISAGMSANPNNFYFTPYTNYTINEADREKQVEVSIDVNPNNPNNMVSAWIDYRVDGRNPDIGVGYSFDGGQTWTDNLLPINIGSFPYQGDPIVAADKDGNFFIAFISFNLSPAWTGGVFVAKSIDGGVTWPEENFRRLDSDIGIDDKTFITIDRTNNATANNIYVVWDNGYSSGTNLDIMFARSTDQGNTFETAYQISDVIRPNQLGAMLSVDPNGELYAVWYAGNVYGFRDFYFDKSSNGGQSFGSDNVIISVDSYYSGYGIKLAKRIYSFPFMVANPVLSGHIYLTWGNRVDGVDPRHEIDSSDVLFIRSTDYGNTWSAPINVFNNGLNPSVTPNDQFMPWIAVSPDGNQISVMYYDRSEFENNDSMLIKISTSVNEGTYFAPPIRFADVPTCPSLDNWGDPEFIGDYNGMVYSSAGTVLPIWADKRNSNFDIYTAPGDVSVVSIPIVSNWQTLSVPLTITDYAKTTNWPTATSDAFKYVCGSGYVAQDELEIGPGYYIKFGSNQSISLAGAALNQLGIPLCAGWNIVGSITTDIPISTNLCLFPAWNSFTSPFYLYQNGYIIVNHLTPGYGYWIKVDVDGSLLLNKDSIQCDSPEFIDVVKFDHFIVTDKLGKKQDLYVANLNLSPLLDEIDLSMPPPLPEVGFDARFATGEYIKPILPDSNGVVLTIDVETVNYPVTLSWELNPENGIEYSFINDSTLGKVSTITDMYGHYSFSNNSMSNIKLFGKINDLFETNHIPNKYMLEQNFPNPFNPITNIQFSIPAKSFVELKVFDILGNEVTILVNEEKPAGKFVVEFSVTGKASKLSSGVYFYQLRAGSFIETKKMILTK